MASVPPSAAQWDSETTYDLGDRVRYQSTIYKSKKDNNIREPSTQADASVLSIICET
ncbi:hypothetical protein BOTBODRAFT_36953 [Botryobasidium botryosum FD-172 SS1]|uniref:Uncharacterized protein n=1 Tax=Botryobasidium botryosum (strain FD-172 SS1) TaxID=930990 RepID=A0A067MCC3_BOTB1|nr:hypothetical protein BOTBODRAFT_36953 [Botryobasidium botryosum FD-172 SS1]